MAKFESKPQAGLMLYREVLIMLSMADADTTNTVVKAATNYFLYDAAPESLTGVAAQIWERARADIDRGRERYVATCERNRANIAKRYQSNANGTPMVSQSNTAGIPLVNQSDASGIPTLSSKPLADNLDPETTSTEQKRKKKFVPPTEEEAAAYFVEQGSTAAEARAFIDYYSSVGWTVGKACKPMKNWKSSAHGWIQRNKQGANAYPAAASTVPTWGALCRPDDPPGEELDVNSIF